MTSMEIHEFLLMAINGNHVSIVACNGPCLVTSKHLGLIEIPAADGVPGSGIINEGLKHQTIEGQ